MKQVKVLLTTKLVLEVRDEMDMRGIKQVIKDHIETEFSIDTCYGVDIVNWHLLTLVDDNGNPHHISKTGVDEEGRFYQETENGRVYVKDCRNTD